jgi:hypothetical protein
MQGAVGNSCVFKHSQIALLQLLTLQHLALQHLALQQHLTL